MDTGLKLVKLGDIRFNAAEILGRYERELLMDPDVKIIWIALPLAAAGLYMLTRRRSPASNQGNGGGTSVPVVHDPVLGDVPLEVTITPGQIGKLPIDPGHAAGTSPAGDVLPQTWSTQDLAALANRIVEREGYNRPELVHAIISVESSWNPRAVNVADSAPRDAVDAGDSFGLMGLKLATAQPFVPGAESYKDLWDPEINITAGVRFLAELERKWLGEHGVAGIIQMYNLGETRFRKGERNSSYLGKVQQRISSYNLAQRSP